MKKTLMDKFLKVTKGESFLPPIHNVSVLALGGGGFIPNFDQMYYKIPLNARSILIMKGEEGITLFSETPFYKVSKHFFTQYWKNVELLNKRTQMFEKFIKEADDIYDKLTLDYISKNNCGVLLENVKKIVDSTRHMSSSSWYVLLFDKKICLDVFNELNIDISKDRLDEIWDKAVIPASDSFDKRRSLYMLKLLKKERNWGVLAEKMQYSQADYSKVRSIKETEDIIKKEFSKFQDEEKIDREIEKLNKEKEIRTNNFNDWLKTLNKEEQKLVMYIQEIIRLRDARKDPISKAIVINYRVAQKMFNEVGIPDKLIYYCAYEELLKGLAYLKHNKEDILKRDKGFAIMVSYDGSLDFEYGTFDQIKKDIEKVQLEKEKAKKEVNEVIGQIACKGKVNGIVRIVRDPSKADDFNEGDILVTGMTRPEFVPLMKKAGAIVTDEGSITCHAAIVSRELNKPCIIGTKIATRILKEGDMVEVDANKGVIITLKKASSK